MTSVPILVRKYGGTSLADVPRLREVARDLKACRDRGYRLVVVVSAMGHTTDKLVADAYAANPDPPRRELDMLLSVGERISMSLLCMALAAETCPALSLTGSQCGIITDGSHTDARILEVKGDRVRGALAAGYVVVVAGFQGVSHAKEITTLGRGGSDATAVALAAALGAERCEILKDVDGVMTADPHLVRDARPHTILAYDEMQAIADAGCGVVHPRAVAYAHAHGVPLVVRSSFTNGPGTMVAAAPPTPPSAERPDFRPLVISVDTPCERMRITWHDGPSEKRLTAAIARVDAETLVAEWLATGAAGHWEGWGTARALDRIMSGLGGSADAGHQVVRDVGLASLSLPGARPRSWPAALATLRDWLADRGLGEAHLRSDGGTVRVLVPALRVPEVLPDLHAWLFPA